MHLQKERKTELMQYEHPECKYTHTHTHTHTHIPEANLLLLNYGQITLLLDYDPFHHHLTLSRHFGLAVFCLLKPKFAKILSTKCHTHTRSYINIHKNIRVVGHVVLSLLLHTGRIMQYTLSAPPVDAVAS